MIVFFFSRWLNGFRERERKRWGSWMSWREKKKALYLCLHYSIFFWLPLWLDFMWGIQKRYDTCCGGTARGNICEWPSLLKFYANWFWCYRVSGRVLISLPVHGDSGKGKKCGFVCMQCEVLTMSVWGCCRGGCALYVQVRQNDKGRCWFVLLFVRLR